MSVDATLQSEMREIRSDIWMGDTYMDGLFGHWCSGQFLQHGRKSWCDSIRFMCSSTSKSWFSEHRSLKISSLQHRYVNITGCEGGLVAEGKAITGKSLRAKQGERAAVRQQ